MFRKLLLALVGSAAFFAGAAFMPTSAHAQWGYYGYGPGAYVRPYYGGYYGGPGYYRGGYYGVNRGYYRRPYAYGAYYRPYARPYAYRPYRYGW